MAGYYKCYSPECDQSEKRAYINSIYKHEKDGKYRFDTIAKTL